MIDKKFLFGALLVFMLSAGFTVMAAPLEVFVSIPPQKWLSDRIGGDLVNTRVLVGKGQNPHTFEPSPKQITYLCRANLYFTMGMEFEEEIGRRIEKSANKLKFVSITDRIKKIAMSEQGAEHSDSVKHHHGELDPHVWLSPLNLKIMAAETAKAFIKKDPANKASYERNLRVVLANLDRLHDAIRQKLAPYKGASFYVFHPSFGYFAHAYGLKQKSVEVGGKSPSPRQLAALITGAKADEARVIFVQPGFDPKSAAAVAGAINGEVVPLDSLAEDVPGSLEIMAQKISKALAGQPAH